MRLRVVGESGSGVGRGTRRVGRLSGFDGAIRDGVGIDSSSRDRGVCCRPEVDGVEVCGNTRWNAPRPDVSYPGTTLVGEQFNAILDSTAGDSRSDGSERVCESRNDGAIEMVVQRVSATGG